MIVSDTFSEKTSSTSPILISFSSHNTKTKPMKNIQNFLKYHPNCQKYLTKGPNFVADGANEFRLYYVDSSLYTDNQTYKRLNVEKEEIEFRTSSLDSTEPTCGLKNAGNYNSSDLRMHGRNVTHNSVKKMDRGIMCNRMLEYQDFHSTDIFHSSGRANKSFQVGPDLRFNGVYVNTDQQISPFFKTDKADETIQTNTADVIPMKNKRVSNENLEDFCQISENSSLKFQVRQSPSFICEETSAFSETDNKKIDTFQSFCSRIEEKSNCFNISNETKIKYESGTTSLKFSIKKSPSFLANYVLQIMKRHSNANFEESEVFETGIVNYVEWKEINRHINNTEKLYKKELKNDVEKERDILKKCKNIKCKHKASPHTDIHPPGKKEGKLERYKNPFIMYNDCSKIDKLKRYQNIMQNSACYTMECLYKCNNLDFFLRKSHYAILKKYYRQLKLRKHKRECRYHHHCRHKKRYDYEYVTPLENLIYNKYDYYKQNADVHNVNTLGEKSYAKIYGNSDSRTRSTISGFLNTFKPWDWQDTSKLSVCLDECFTEKSIGNDHLYSNVVTRTPFIYPKWI